MTNQLISHTFYSDEVEFIFCSVANSESPIVNINNMHSSICSAVKNNNISEAIDLLLKIESLDRRIKHDVILLSRAINHCKSKYRTGCIGEDEYNKQANKCLKGLLELNDEAFDGKI